MQGKIQKIFGREIIDQNAISQLENCLIEDSLGVLSADAHKGYSMPIGGIVAYTDKISPSGVGYDIACGNMAVKTNISYHDLGTNDTKKFMDEIVKNIGFGVGRPNQKPVDHEVFDKIANAEFEPQRKLINTAKAQLGTIGSGNHYIDLFVEKTGTKQEIWIGVHFGSRGFGHKTASGFMAMAQGLKFDEHAKEGSMDAKPILFDDNSAIGEAYWEAMLLAGAYAYAGRETVVNEVLKILGAKATFTVHNHHNFAWREAHHGTWYNVIRKGATPAFPGQYGFIGANMADDSVIIKGVDTPESQEGLYSTVHGAGRILSRTQAAGKQKWIKGEDGKKRPTRVSKGLIDWDAVKNFVIEDCKIELRGAGADEAPGCYKNLKEVLAYHGDTVEVVHVLKPIGVAMAGPEVEDPYKD